MTKRTEAEMEARYDAERDGTLYVKPQPTDHIPTLLDQCRSSDRSEASINALVEASAPAIFARWAEEDAAAGIIDTEDDEALTPDEETALNIILARQDEEEAARESVPVPPVPAGYPTDLAMIYTSYGETFISIDRRDGELLICNKCETAGDEEEIVILSPARAMALYRFFWSSDMVELMEYHRKNAAA